MPELPPCPEPTCERSDVVVEERNGCFVFRCRTCNCVNVFPFEKEEKRGRYHAYLQQRAREEAEYEKGYSRRAYSIPGVKP